jgi:hypothetical protein
VAHFPFTDGFVTLNSVDLSAHVVSCDLDYDNTTVEDGPCMGQTSRKNLYVITNWTARIRFKQDFAASQVHASLESLARAGTSFAMRVRPDKSDAISATNPEFQADGIIQSFKAMGGTFGEVPETEIVIVPTGANAAITVDTTP